MFGFDFMNSVFPVIFTVMFVGIFIMFIVTAVRGIGRWHKNNNSPRLTVDATIVSKRMDVTHHHNSTTHEFLLHLVLRHVPGHQRRPHGAFDPHPGLRLPRRRRPRQTHLPGHPLPQLRARIIPTLHPVSLPETGFLRPHAFPYAGKPWTAQIQSLPWKGSLDAHLSFLKNYLLFFDKK